VVYLIHFEEPFHHARHYIGFCEENLDQRMECHRRGDGAKLMRAVSKAGIPWKVVRTWPDGDRNFERKLKNRHKSQDFCPICKEAKKRGGVHCGHSKKTTA
jgi:predicted GIY-YIG superfamily endonuclease